MITTEWSWLADFLSALGLFLDIFGFGLLARDAFAAFGGERIAWMRVKEIRSMAYRNRYGLWGLSEEHAQREEDEFNARLDTEQVQFEAAMDAREWRVRLGVRLIIGGFSLQILGVMPFWS